MRARLHPLDPIQIERIVLSSIPRLIGRGAEIAHEADSGAFSTIAHDPVSIEKALAAVLEVAEAPDRKKALAQEDRMKRLFTTSALVGALLVGSASAQEGTAPAPAVDGQTTAQATTPEVIRRTQDPSELRVEWISGSTVTSPQDETIGTVEDLIMDGESSEITAAVITIGGFLGFGAKQIAVDWQELRIDYDAQQITLDLTREEAEAAPAYAFRDRERPPSAAPVPAGPATEDDGRTGGMATPSPQ